MDQIISLLSRQLNLSEASVRSAVRSLLEFAREKSAGTEFSSFVSAIPGADELLAEPAPAKGPEAGGGLLGSLLGSAGGLLGGQTMDLARLVNSLEAAGIPADRVLPFAKGFFNEIQSVAGEERVNQVLARYPALTEILRK